jgi:glycosyltransferase involved in cell wall biosynthesis
MKILHVITTVGTGGAERMLLNVVAGRHEAAFEHGVVALRRGGMLAEPLRMAGAQVWNCGLREGDLSLEAGLQIRKILSAFSPDIVQGWMYHGNVAACLFKTLWRACPSLVWGIHHSIDDLRNEKRLTRGLIRVGALLSRWPSRIIFVSRTSRRQHAALGYYDRHAATIPNGFDCQLFRPRAGAREALRHALGLERDVVVIGKVAVVRPMKDHANLLRACAILRARGLPFHLVLIGQQTTEDNAELMRLIEQAGVRDRVSLLGERHDMPTLMAGLDALVVSSAWGEAFPIVLGEAMASGVPCVTTDLGDSAWIVGDTGVIVPPREPAALAEAMAQLITVDAQRRRQLGERARARIEEHFELRGVVQRYYDLYRHLARQRKSVDRVAPA